ncbi:ATP-binding cassette domain-containing protein [Phytohabitans kaempferiae]|uniref:ATP-binding cassette domain-containing protein n=2 Tax=Phytohabitans kaempferiae TaxID=1620943 RepID=A0ABV6M2Y1_9ACTN
MPVVEARSLRKSFHTARGVTVAVDDVSFTIEEGRTLGLIGESGSGKSTTGRLVLRLHDLDGGSVHVDGTELGSLSRAELRAKRAAMQMVFQEPFESLNPRMTIGEILAEPLLVHQRDLTRSAREARVLQMIEEVGLDPLLAQRRPRSLSGGQQQRVGIARAAINNPRFLVLDEPTSSLDLSVRVQILDLLARLQDRHGMAYLYISHDLATVNHIAHDVAVMHHGRIVEAGSTETVLRQPSDPYTIKLLDAYLSPDPRIRRRRYDDRSSVA